MPFHQVREGQEDRGNKLPVSRIYSSSSDEQESKATIEDIVVLRSVTCTGSLHIPSLFADEGAFTACPELVEAAGLLLRNGKLCTPEISRTFAGVP